MGANIYDGDAYQNILTRMAEDGSVLWTTHIEYQMYFDSIQFSTLLQKPAGGYWMAGNRTDNRISIWETDADGVLQNNSPIFMGGVYQEHLILSATLGPDDSYIVADNSSLPYPLDIQDIYILNLSENNY